MAVINAAKVKYIYIAHVYVWSLQLRCVHRTRHNGTYTTVHKMWYGGFISLDAFRDWHGVWVSGEGVRATKDRTRTSIGLVTDGSDRGGHLKTPIPETMRITGNGVTARLWIILCGVRS